MGPCAGKGEEWFRDGGEPITPDNQGLPLADAVRPPPREDFYQTRRAPSQPLDEPKHSRSGTENLNGKNREERQHHLGAYVSEQADDAKYNNIMP